MLVHHFPIVETDCLARITDEDSVHEMRIWSTLSIKSDLKWCIHPSRSLFIFNINLVS